MTHIDFTPALIRLSKNKIGMNESCTLFAIADGATYGAIAKATGADKATVAARMGVLKRKGLAMQCYDDRGNVYFQPTNAGAKIIRQTINEKSL